MTDAERIAAEVAARYGVAVHADAVQIVPRGVSAFQPESLDWKRQILARRRNADRVRRVMAAEGRLEVEAEPVVPVAPVIAKPVAPPRAKPPVKKAEAVRSARAGQRDPVLQERDAELRRLVAEGQTARQIAAKFGISKGALWFDIKRLGLTPVRPSRAVTRARRAAEVEARRVAREAERAALLGRMREMAEAGQTAPQIAAALDMDYDMVRKAMQRAGISVRRAKSPGGKPVPLDPEMVAALWRQGMSMHGIARERRWSIKRVRIALAAAGIERDDARFRRAPEVQARIDAVAALAVLGLSRREICARLGIAPTQYDRAARVLGLTGAGGGGAADVQVAA